MIGLGTIVNALAVAAGGIAGLIIKKGLSENIQDTLMKALGLATVFIGLSGALTGLIYIENGVIKTGGSMLMIISLVLGSIAGEFIDIENKLEILGEKIKVAVKMKGDSKFVEGFVTNALVICIGAMAVVGSLQDGLNHDASMLYAKAVLDCLISMVFAATLGVGVIFAGAVLFVYQGSITLLASVIAPYLSDGLINNISYIGSVLIFGVGINLIFGKKIKVGNMLPALVVPVIYEIIFL